MSDRDPLVEPPRNADSWVQRLFQSTLLRYCVVGGFTFGTNLGLLALFHEVVGLPASWAYACALVAILSINFVLARHFIFRSRASSPQKQAISYLTTTLTIRGLEWLTFTGLEAWLDLWYIQLAAMVQVVFFFTKYFFYRATVFRPDNQAETPASTAGGSSLREVDVTPAADAALTSHGESGSSAG